MHRFLYLNLALQSIRKNYRITVPFIAGSTLMVCMIYSMMSLCANPTLAGTFGGRTMQMTLDLGVRVVMFFTLLFFFYLNSVWMKNRSQENGLYTVLGMEKHHLIRIVTYELLASLVISLAAGFVLGVCLDKVMFLIILRIISPDVQLGFYISWSSMANCSLWILLCYGAIWAYTIFTMLRTNPLEQMHGKSIGERPIKNRWILAVAGVLSLGAGYGIALTVKDPVSALLMFFVAVILVIIGTYLLFMFGSTVLISMMQKHRGFYYKPNHFISVSSMKYRMKANAAALANIAILSTMILVTLSTTTSLIAGIDTMVNRAYARDARVTLLDSLRDDVTYDMIENAIMDNARTAGWNPSDPVTYAEQFVSFKHGSRDFEGEVVSLADYNRISSQNIELGEHQLLSFSSQTVSGETLIGEDGTTYEIIQAENEMPSDFTKRFFGDTTSQWMVADFSKNPGLSPQIFWNVQFDSPVNLDWEDVEQADEVMAPFWNTHDLSNLTVSGEPAAATMVSFKETQRQEGLALYSGLLFIGVYVSALFILVVILIMYYKQVSEGIEDRERFAILQKVGLEQRQIKKVINDQVLVMFFLPLLTALIHIAFAYPMISKILNLLVFSSPWLFIIVTSICFGIFALVYIVIYKLTARTYYKLTCLPQ